MRRHLNAPIWIGFLVVLAALFTYLPLFARFPATRDAPWPTFLLFGCGLALIGFGLRRAVRDPQVYRGKIAGVILLGVSLAIVAFFGAGFFYFARQLPASTGAPRIGEKAPDFTLPDQDGHQVTLSKWLEPGPGSAMQPKGVVLIFYRGFW